CFFGQHQINPEQAMKKAYPYIRWSTKVQEHGDSEHRQRKVIEQSKEWLEGLGYELDWSMNLIDRGKSGFKKGQQEALDRFLKAVKTGKVKAGSVLIAENQDRITRDTPKEALRLFFDLQDYGINIGICDKRKMYKSDSDELEDLLVQALDATRSHEHSKRKSEGLLEFHKTQRTTNGKIHTPPPWLKMNYKLKPNGNKEFISWEIRPGAKETIENIFEWYLDDAGVDQIVQKLTDKRWWKRQRKDKNGELKDYPWSTWSIYVLLRNRQVLGEFQYHQWSKDGKWVPASDVITGYYLEIIPKKLFEDVKQKIAKNYGDGSKASGFCGGRKGDHFNLFRNIARCGLCGGTMNLGGNKRWYRHLRCRRSLDKVADPKTGKLMCTASGVHYDELQASVLNNLQELDFDKFMPQPAKITKEIKVLEKSIADYGYKLQEVNKKINSYTFAIGKLDAENPEHQPIIEGHNQMLISLYKDKPILDGAIKELENKKREREYERKDQHLRKDKIREYRELIDSAKGDAETESRLRAQLKEELERLIHHLIIFPLNGKTVPGVMTRTRWVVKAEGSTTIRKIYIDFGFKKFEFKLTKGS
ncbi:MAG: recombinase family protein, partial [Candidatus Paceibacterota bacterium]